MCVFVWFKRAVQLEQMDLEVREIPIQSRAMYNSRLKSYKQEVEKLEKDFVSTAAAPSPPLVPLLFLLLFCWRNSKNTPSSTQGTLQMSDAYMFFFCRKQWLHVTAWLSPSQTLLALCSHYRQTCHRSSARTAELSLCEFPLYNSIVFTLEKSRGAGAFVSGEPGLG